MLRRVALVRTDVSEGLSVSIIRVTRIGEIGTTLAVTGKSLTHVSLTEQFQKERRFKDDFAGKYKHESFWDYVLWL
jgi:hypothetical protein